jgi:miniconductance mechanosensitive channel
LDWLGINSAEGGYKSLFATVVVLVCCVVIWRLLRYILLRAHRLGKMMDERLAVVLDVANLKKIALTASVILFYMLMPLAFDPTSALGVAIRKVLDVLLVWMFASATNTVIKTIFMLIYHKRKRKDAPLKGFMQIIQIVVWILAIIVIVAILIDKSPGKLLAGLGASLAVLSFVFKDTILNFVSGILLSSDKMVKVGDWIEMPSRGIDGVVVAVSLTTIKIRSWNNTLQTIPPYLLISEPFDNWQAMRDSGGRRIKRNINIDMSSVRFADEAFIESLRTNEATAEIMKSIATSLEEGGVVTNLDIYMRYINRYLDTHPRLNHTMTCMVRQLQPTEWGLPVELYFFTADVNWVPYEHLQAEVMSRIIALAPHFGIRLYQAPSGQDFKTK